jgi:hypothetical protein
MATDSNETLSYRRVPEDAAATPDEVKAAVETLTEGQLVKLEKYARYRVRGLGRKALGRDYNDLLRDAITATLAGDRRWRKGTVDFFTHLTGVMRSISSHWGEQYDPEEALGESELMHDDNARSPIVSAASEAPSVERILDARERLLQIERHFAADPAVPSILKGLRDGMTGPEIQLATGMSKKDYESAIKRMRRGIASMREDRP